jgi:hypothetical protein
MTAIKDMFGKPSEGVHSYRLGGLAIVDVVFTVLAAFLLSYVSRQPVMLVMFLLFLFGIFCHFAFSVDTVINRFLFGPPKS